MAAAGDEEVRGAIRKLLEVSNRPYNANNLIDELSSRFKKALINKALQALEESKEIQTKTFGKVKIYLADQRIFPLPNEQELAELDADIERRQKQNQDLKAELAKLQSVGDALEAQPTNTNLESNLEELSSTVHKMKQQVAQCKASVGNGADSAPIDKKTLEKTLSQTQANLKKRKRLCTSVLGDMEAQSGMDRKTLYDMIGIEGDE